MKIENMSRDRRLQFFEVDGPTFAEVITGGIFLFDSELPEDTEYVTTHFDFKRDVFMVLLRSSYFEEVMEGYCIPIFSSNGLITRIED